MHLRNGEKWPGWREVKKTLQESREHDPELQWVYGKLLHEVYFRLDAAMPHTDDSVRCADAFTAIDDGVHRFERI